VGLERERSDQERRGTNLIKKDIFSISAFGGVFFQSTVAGDTREVLFLVKAKGKSGIRKAYDAIPCSAHRRFQNSMPTEGKGGKKGKITKNRTRKAAGEAHFDCHIGLLVV
jgi:hypothetical protein